MDFSNHIKFEGNLIKTRPTTITYSGFLFENGSESVSIVYGFGSRRFIRINKGCWKIWL